MLKDIFVFDNSEPSNCESFKNLPSFFQDYITQKHSVLVKVATKLCENQSFKPLITSGYRSPSVNKKVGGVSNSLHLHGLAIDFICVTRLGDVPLKCSNVKEKLISAFNKDFENDLFTLIYEKNHFHLQFKRTI